MTTPSGNPEIGRAVRAHGVDTNYLCEGSGAPVVLVHGSGPGVTGYANWRTVIPRLAGDFTIYAPDIVGFGYTERPEGFEYTLESWLTHLLGFLDAMEIEKAHFIGNSFGGALSLALASRHPGRVDRLVLMGSAGLRFEMTEGLEAVWSYQPSIAAMTRLMSFFAHRTGLVTAELIESRYRASIRPGYQESFARMFAEPRQEKLNALATPENQLRQVPHRTLVIHGREDRIVPVSSSVRLSTLLPHADLHVFAECGHWTQVEKNAEFCALVQAFLHAGAPAK